MKNKSVEAFLNALQQQDLEAAMTFLADDVVLKSPVVVEPFVGKAAVLGVVKALLSIVDGLEIVDILEGERHCAVFHRIRVGTHTIDGVDDMRLNGVGLVHSVTVMWRPLPAVVATQNRLAPFLSLQQLELLDKK